MFASKIKTSYMAFYAICCGVTFIAAAALPARTQEWHPSGPEKDMKDWVKLKSGEWLRGKMELFRDLKMEFDSDELNDLILDWEDITAFRFPREMTFVFDEIGVFTGSASMVDGMIRINAVDGPVDRPRSALLSIIEGTLRERNFWSTKVNVGYTQRTGNTDQIDLVGDLLLKRDATRSRTSLQYRGDFSEVNGSQTVNSHKVNFDLDLYISLKFFITLVSLEYYTDKFQNIDSRNAAGAGVGYFIFRRSKLELSVGAGGAYQSTLYLSVEEGEDIRAKTGAVIPTVNLEWDITKKIEWDFEYNSRIGVPDIKTSSHHIASGVSIDFYKDIFEVTFSVLWDRVDNPQAYSDGTVPEKDDLKLVFGFGIDL
jgi:hypothetical protein